MSLCNALGAITAAGRCAEKKEEVETGSLCSHGYSSAEKQPLPLTQLSFHKLLFLSVTRKKKKMEQIIFIREDCLTWPESAAFHFLSNCIASDFYKMAKIIFVLFDFVFCFSSGCLIYFATYLHT